jgi:hypothetical protein
MVECRSLGWLGGSHYPPRTSSGCGAVDHHADGGQLEEPADQREATARACAEGLVGGSRRYHRAYPAEAQGNSGIPVTVHIDLVVFRGIPLNRVRVSAVDERPRPRGPFVVGSSQSLGNH